MENRISIPKPCHENWEAMLPEEQGRHCLSCCKTVVDFSSWDNERILAYLQQRNTERVCGRFNAEQVAAPKPEQHDLVHQVIRSGVPVLRKVAAIIILCFGLGGFSSANAQEIMGKIAPPKQQTTNHTKGEVAIAPQTDTTKVTPPKADTLKPKPIIMGMIAPYHPPQQKPLKPLKPAKPKKAAPATSGNK